MPNKRNLLLGCGHDRRKRVFLQGSESWDGELVLIDMNKNCGASVVWNLDILPWPLQTASFDEIHAYDVLEHLGTQGDWRRWFAEMAEVWRLLKPNGLFAAIVPINADALADPGHRRFFSQSYFNFLSQDFYRLAREQGANVTDYTWYWHLDFEMVHMQEDAHHLYVMMRKRDDKH